MNTATETVLVAIVKGTPLEAARAAADRGIPFAYDRMTRCGETVGLVPAAFLADLARWHGEGDYSAPFPVGTLLLYSKRTLREDSAR